MPCAPCAELGYEVTVIVIKDATATYSDDVIHAALDINIPNYASAIVARGISAELLKWKAIEVAHELSKSPNAKLIVLGDKTGLPIIFSDK